MKNLEYTKEHYIELVNDKFEGIVRELILKNIDLFYKKDIQVYKNTYNVGEEVFLKKGTFIHGIDDSAESCNDFKIFDYVVEHGFIGGDFNNLRTVKFHNSVGMWNIKNDMKLKDYIYSYSGVTIRYRVGDRKKGLTDYYELVPHKKIEDRFVELNNKPEVWQWNAEQTKEVRFIPSLYSEKNQIAFILNMDSDYAKKVANQDVWNPIFRKEEILKYFCSHLCLPEMLKGDFNAATTDRESSIMFGITSRLIEGVLVGRKIEKNEELLNYIKTKLPNCYICNLDGKVIVGNKES